MEWTFMGYSIYAIIAFLLFFISTANLLFKLLDDSAALKKERIAEKAKDLEEKMDSFVDTNSFGLVEKYRKIIKESFLARFYINIYMYLFLSVGFSYWVFIRMRELFNQFTAAAMLAAVALLLPFVVLEFEVNIRRNRVRKYLDNFLLMFSQMYRVYGDSMSALRGMTNEMREPIKGYILEFIKNVNRKGKTPKEAAEILKDRVDNEVFQSFCDEIRNDLEYGKDICTSIEILIQKARQHQINYQERTTENSGNFVSIVMVLGIFAMGTSRLVNMNMDFMEIVRTTEHGRMMINVVIGIMIAVFFMIKKSVSYDDK